MLKCSKSLIIAKKQAIKRPVLVKLKRTSKVSEVIEAFHLVATKNRPVPNTQLLKTGVNQRENRIGLTKKML